MQAYVLKVFMAVSERPLTPPIRVIRANKATTIKAMFEGRPGNALVVPVKTQVRFDEAEI